MSTPTRARKAFAEWVAEQPVQWAVVTLKPALFNKSELQRAAKLTLEEFEHTYPKSLYKKERRRSKRPMLHRVVIWGGDRKSGVRHHFHVLLEVLGSDWERFERKLICAWDHSAKQVIKERLKDCPSKLGQSDSLKQESTKIWVEQYAGNVQTFMHYAQRFEGIDQLGTDKVELSLTNISRSQLAA